jgi:hypothetical protein
MEVAGNTDIDEEELSAMPVANVVSDDDDSGSESDADYRAEAPAIRRHPDLPDEIFNTVEQAEEFQRQMTITYKSGVQIDCWRGCWLTTLKRPFQSVY